MLTEGLEVELTAAEIVRRAERCIGLAIRKGQKEGRIAKRGEGGGPRRKKPTANGSRILVASLGSRSDELSRGPYALADGVTEAQFESALEGCPSC